MSELPEIGTGEEELFATLLSVVEQACSTMEDNELDSWALSSYARAMRLLSGAGFIEIQSEADGRVLARVTPEGAALLDRLYEQEKQEALREQHRRSKQTLDKEPK
jgi:hypothetical protein